MTVWYVYRVEVENDGVCGVFSTRELAQSHCDELFVKRQYGEAYWVASTELDSGEELDGGPEPRSIVSGSISP